MIRRLLLGAVVLAGLVAPVLAAAPVKVTADQFTVDEPNRQAVFTGNVVVKHPTLDLWANKVIVFYGDGGTSDIDSFEATGEVKIKTKTQTANGDKATYDPTAQVLRLTGKVMVETNGNVLSGPELVVNLVDNTSTFSGGGGSGGRVTGVFTPK